MHSYRKVVALIFLLFLSSYQTVNSTRVHAYARAHTDVPETGKLEVFQGKVLAWEPMAPPILKNVQVPYVLIEKMDALFGLSTAKMEELAQEPIPDDMSVAQLPSPLSKLLTDWTNGLGSPVAPEDMKLGKTYAYKYHPTRQNLQNLVLTPTAGYTSLLLWFEGANNVPCQRLDFLQALDLPAVKIIAVHAPLMELSVDVGGSAGAPLTVQCLNPSADRATPMWYPDLGSDEPYTGTSCPDPWLEQTPAMLENIKAMVEAIDSLIDAELRLKPSLKHVAAGGFSLGGAFAMHMALRSRHFIRAVADVDGFNGMVFQDVAPKDSDALHIALSSYPTSAAIEACANKALPNLEIDRIHGYGHQVPSALLPKLQKFFLESFGMNSTSVVPELKAEEVPHVISVVDGFENMVDKNLEHLNVVVLHTSAGEAPAAVQSALQFVDSNRVFVLGHANVCASVSPGQVLGGIILCEIDDLPLDTSCFDQVLQLGGSEALNLKSSIVFNAKVQGPTCETEACHRPVSFMYGTDSSDNSISSIYFARLLRFLRE